MSKRCIIKKYRHMATGKNTMVKTDDLLMICDLAEKALDTEVVRPITEAPTVEEIARVTGWMIRMCEAVTGLPQEPRYSFEPDESKW